MRRDEGNELAGGNDLGLFPKPWEMTLIAGYKVVRTGSIGTFNEFVVVRIGRNFKLSRRYNNVGPIFYELKKLLPQSPANLQFRARQYCLVLGQN